jgi:TRAP-type transport system periplasmic protein
VIIKIKGGKNKMKKIFLAAFPIVLIISLILSGCAGKTSSPTQTSTTAPATTTSSTAPPSKIELKVGSLYAPTHPYGIALQAWMDKITQETNGRVNFAPYWSASVISNADNYLELTRGVVDIGELGIGTTKTGWGIAKMEQSLYYGVADWQTGWKIYKEVHSKLKVDPEEETVKILGRQADLYYHLISTKPVRKVADLKGLQVRASGGNITVFNALGASASMVPMADVYTSLEKGSLDAALGPYEPLATFHWADLCHYIARLNLMIAPTVNLGMNLDTWNKLPQDVQKVFADNLEFYVSKLAEIWEDAQKKGLDEANKKGVEIVDLPDINLFYAECEKVVRASAAQLDTQGLPGTQVVDETRRLVEQYSK